MKTDRLVPDSNQEVSGSQIIDTPQPIQTASPPKHFIFGKKFSKWMIVGLIVILFGIILVFVYKNYQLRQQLVEKQPVLLPESTPVLTPTLNPTSSPLDGWQIYVNKKYGYSLKYPKSFVIEELPQRVCPPAVVGCRTVKEKGDQVRVYNERSSFIIKIDNEMQYPTIGSVCAEKFGKISEIVIDGDTLYEEKSPNTDSFMRIISKYEERKLGGKRVFCPEIIWLHNNYKITISTDVSGTFPDDDSTIRKILEGITFNSKTAI